MGLGYIFSRSWIVEILFDANFISWICLFSFFVTGKTLFLLGFFLTWLLALGLAALVKYQWRKREQINERSR